MHKQQERYKEAIREPYSVAKVLKEQETRPGNKPKHVFDFEDGIRLIISRDYHKDSEYIHFSGSVSDTHFKGIVGKNILDMMLRKFKDLTGYEGQPQFGGITPGGIPHWFIEKQKLN